MFRQVTMILLAVAVLIGSGHASSWSHEHGSDHAAVAAHVNDHVGDRSLTMGEEMTSESSDIKGEVVSPHSHPFGIAVGEIRFANGLASSRSLNVIAPERMLASYSQAPPTEPPAA